MLRSRSKQLEAEKISALVKASFQIVFGRDPEEEGLSYWIKKVNDEKLDELNLIKHLASTTEARQMKERKRPLHLEPKSSDLVKEAFAIVLGRSPEDEALQFWTAEVDTKCMSPLALIKALSDTEEAASMRKAGKTITHDAAKHVVSELYKNLAHAEIHNSLVRSKAEALQNNVESFSEIIADAITFGNVLVRRNALVSALNDKHRHSMVIYDRTRPKPEHENDELALNFSRKEVRGFAEGLKPLPQSEFLLANKIYPKADQTAPAASNQRLSTPVSSQTLREAVSARKSDLVRMKFS